MAGRDSRLSWSSLDMYENCPQRYLWKKGWESLDLGYGMGEPKPTPQRDSEHHAFMGIVIQAVIERFYNNEIWKYTKGPSLIVELEKITEEVFVSSLSESFIDWEKAPSKKDLMDVCRSGVLGYLSTLKHYKFLGPYARSEVDLVCWIDDAHPIMGRPDMIIRRDDTGVTILDGKNSKHKDKYLNEDQLRWYALCFYLCYHELPTRLGYVFWRFPYGMKNENTGEIEEGVKWVSFNEADLRRLAKRAKKAKWSMLEEKFDPNPVPSYCRFCEYESMCSSRQEQRELNARKRDRDPINRIEGVKDFGFGDFPEKG